MKPARQKASLSHDQAEHVTVVRGTVVMFEAEAAFRTAEEGMLSKRFQKLCADLLSTLVSVLSAEVGATRPKAFLHI